MSNPPFLRKQPRQNRSRQMRTDILDAAIRVLRQGDVSAFRTTHIAHVAGISVGSLYQYYSDKEAILGDLQGRIIERAWDVVSGILSDPEQPPRAQILAVTRYFFAAEAEEIRLLGAFSIASQDTGRETKEQMQQKVLRLFTQFVAAIPDGDHARKTPQADAAFLIATLDGMGHYYGQQNLNEGQIAKVAYETAQTVLDHLHFPPYPKNPL